MADRIDAGDYEVLCLLAREFNEWVPPERARTSAAGAPSDAKGDRPGDDFNRRARWEDVLAPHGWTVDHTAGDVTYWTRPGKARHTSATTGKCKTEGGGDLLYVFSTNAHPLEADTAYSKFAALALLSHGGDFARAAAELKRQNYGAGDPVVAWAEPEVSGAEADDVAGIDDLVKAGAEIRWVWPNWIQRGVVTAVAAEGGTGKTRFMADLVRRVRHRIGWPDHAVAGRVSPIDLPPSKWVALWVVSDNHHDEMVTLCKEFGIADCVKLNAAKSDPYGGVTLDAADEFAALEKRVKAVKPLFVIVDTVGNATDRNLSRQEDAKAFYQPLQLISRRQAAAVMALTHLNANGKVLGRRALEKVRTCIRMNGDGNKDSTRRRLEITKSNSMKPPALGVTMGGTGNEYDDKPPPPPEDQDGGGVGASGKKASTAVQEFADVLRPRVEQTAIRVGDAIKFAESKGHGSSTAYAAMALLGLEEVVENGKKWWRIPLAS